MPPRNLRHDCARCIRFRDDPSLILVAPPPPATDATANLDASARRGSVNYMVDHICEPILSTPFASSELRRPPQDGGKTPLTPRRRPHRDRLQCSRALDPSDRARAQKSSLRRLRRWRRAVGSHCLARRNLQNERRRSASLLTRRALKDRRAPSHGSDRLAAAVRLCAGGREGCGLKTPLTIHLGTSADNRSLSEARNHRKRVL